MKMLKIFLLFTLLLALSPSYADAHPGGTDGNGGHTCKTNCTEKWGLSYGEYHYNGGKASTSSSTTVKQSGPSAKEIIMPPFYHPSFDIQYPTTDTPVKNKLKDFGDKPKIRNKLVYEFIEEVRRVSPVIVFGIALRRGEVVNLTSATVPTDFLSGSNYIAILENQDRLFKNLY